MNKAVFVEILGKLEGLRYFFISGLSVAARTNGVRTPGDIDVVVHSDDVAVFASRLGATPHKRTINKGSFTVTDIGFETNYKNQAIECTTGYPPKRVQEGTFEKLFAKKVEIEYLGNMIWVEPLEELVNQKAFMGREKDFKDLELLKGKYLDYNLLVEISKEKGNTDIVMPVLRKFFDL